MRAEFNEALDNWGRWLSAAGKSAGTVQQRTGDLRRFSNFTFPFSATENEIVSYYTYGKAIGWRQNYLRRVQTSIRVFYQWAVKRGYYEFDPTEDIDVTRTSPGIPNPIEDKVLVRGFSAEPSLATKFMIALGAESGLRRTEIAAAHPADRHGKLLRVIGKGGKERMVPLGDDGYELALAIESNQGRSIFYFPGGTEGHIHPATVYKQVRKATGSNVHSLRHRAATNALDKTKDIRSVQEFLGHASVSTTQVYTKVNPTAIMQIGMVNSIRRASEHSIDLGIEQRIVQLDLDRITPEQVMTILEAAAQTAFNPLTAQVQEIKRQSA